MTKRDLVLYKNVGYWGFILRYRKRHNGADPSHTLMDYLERARQKSAVLWFWRVFAFIIAVLT